MELYDAELDKVIDRIKANNVRLVCIQLPDGMKPEAEKIQKRIKEMTDARVLIWLGSNFGACDIPRGLDSLGVDLLISWGHNFFHKTKGW